ncbi:MAG TPA: hypothetical protein VJ890_09535 [Vineibacter sp.]|nr:hypothetical protein [Vineibacter sp.]
MNQATVIEVLKNQAAGWREAGATRLFMFGPRARGADRSYSDLDHFIDYAAADDA